MEVYFGEMIYRAEQVLLNCTEMQLVAWQLIQHLYSWPLIELIAPRFFSVSIGEIGGFEEREICINRRSPFDGFETTAQTVGKESGLCLWGHRVSINNSSTPR